MADSLSNGHKSPRRDWSASCSPYCSLGTRWRESRTGCPAFLSKFIVIGGVAMGLKKTAAEQRCDEIVAFISNYVSRNGYSPAFREVGEAVGLHSPSSVSKYLHRLAKEGRIFSMNPGRALSPPSTGATTSKRYPGAFVWRWPTAANYTWIASCKSPGQHRSTCLLTGYWMPSPCGARSGRLLAVRQAVNECIECYAWRQAYVWSLLCS